MTDFAYPHKVVVRRSAFTTFPSVQNGGELKGGAKIEGCNINFYKCKGI
jgi:hypothetical protein